MTAIAEPRVARLGGVPRQRATRRTAARVIDAVATAVLWTIAGFIVLVMGYIIFYTLQQGLQFISWQFLTTSGFETGVAPQMFNTLYMLLLAFVPTFLLGTGAAIYITEYARQGFLVRALRFATETLTSTPSIVMGLLGFLLFVTHFGSGHFWGFSRLAGVLVLIFLNLPWMTRTAEDALRAVPREIRDGSLALGATTFQTTWRAVLPAAIPGLTTGAVIVIGRIIGETAALIYTAGVASPVSGWLSPQLINLQGDTLAVHIYSLFADNPTPEAARSQAATAVVLIVFILALNLLTRFIGSRIHRALSGRPS